MRGWRPVTGPGRPHLCLPHLLHGEVQAGAHILPVYPFQEWGGLVQGGRFPPGLELRKQGCVHLWGRGSRVGGQGAGGGGQGGQRSRDRQSPRRWGAREDEAQGPLGLRTCRGAKSSKRTLLFPLHCRIEIRTPKFHFQVCL